VRIGVPRESLDGENRVAIIPDTVRKLTAKGIESAIQSGAGVRAHWRDADYEAAGATVVPGFPEVAEAADTIVKIHRPTDGELAQMRPGQGLVALLYALSNPGLVQDLAARRILSISLDLIPRTTLAQSMDVLSSQANLAGYWAVVAAAGRLPKIFPLLMTAAGTIAPARVLVMGVGVAGLQAIGTAKRLGAVVEATDVRPETREQVESLGGKFLMVQGVEAVQGTGGYAAEQSEEYRRRQAELVSAAISNADVVITTALIPGRRAPVLVTSKQVESMRPGSVIVDLAADQGGNVEGCEPGEDVERNGVTIIGSTMTASNVSVHASQVFSRNIEKLLLHTTTGGEWKLDPSDEITRGCLVPRDGEVHQARVREMLSGGGNGHR
jgi:H+-translocating NAD(P) transhydrogenase subunit alpha